MLFLIIEGFCWFWFFIVVDFFNLSVSWWIIVEYGVLDWFREKKKIRCICERLVSSFFCFMLSVCLYISNSGCVEIMWVWKKNSFVNIGNNSELFWVLIFFLLMFWDNEVKFRLRVFE